MHTHNVDFGDFEWFAVDHIGQVGMFTNGGSDVFPQCLVNGLNTRAVFHTWKHFQAFLAICSHSLMIEREPGICYESWISMSDRGMFGYDFNLDDQTGYQLISIPEKPIIIPKAGLQANNSLMLVYYNGQFGKEMKHIDSKIVLNLSLL